MSAPRKRKPASPRKKPPAPYVDHVSPAISPQGALVLLLAFATVEWRLGMLLVGMYATRNAMMYLVVYIYGSGTRDEP